MTTEGTHRVMDNITGQPVRGGLSEEAASWLCRGLNLRDGPGGRYSVRPADPAALIGQLRAAAAGLAELAPWQWQAVRGRIILGWLTEYGVSFATLNDRPVMARVDDPAALTAGIHGLVSAGPEYVISPDGTP